MVVSSYKKVAVVMDVETEEGLNTLASKLSQDVDVILREGYKQEKRHK